MNISKNGLKVSAILVTTLAMCVSLGYCASFQYETHGRRDPFVPLLNRETTGVMKLADVTSIDDISLEGIAIGASGKRIVIVNGEMLKEKDKIGEVVIIKIGKKAVELSIEDIVYTVPLPEEGGTKSGLQTQEKI